VIIGFARRDFEPTGQLCAGQGDYNVIVQAEVTRTADNALQFTGAICLANVDLAVPNGLFELRELFDFYDLADNQRASGLRDRLISFGFKPHADETGVHIGSGHAPIRIGGAKDTGNPVLGNKHDVSILSGF
jgi:hypothetical protein